ncbi:MAG: hypothetical protein AB9856_09775 [Cellulosilyticaceae bacterium]
MDNSKCLKWINVVAFIFLLAASFVFSRGNMFQTGNSPLFLPAPYTFSIWLLIYVLLGIWVLLPFFRPAQSDYEAVGYWFAITLLLAGMSILVPVNFSAFFIVGALISAIIVYVRIRDDSKSTSFSKLTFSLLLGWLSVATIANISVVLKNLGITQILGLGEVAWTIIMLGIGAALAIIVAIKEEDNIYPLVFVWGFIGIAVQNKAIPAVVRMALLVSFILLIAVAYNWYSKKIKNS